MYKYLETRFLSAIEASYYLCSFNTHDRSHTVYRLPVHLEDAQNIIFDPRNIQDALDRELFRKTKLTGWFELNKQALSSNPRQFKYIEIPNHYKWENGEWKERIQDGSKVIGRMYYINPNQGELYYLRLLLLHVTGCTSFESIRTFNDVTYPTYKAVCIARNLLENDKQWYECLREASAFKMPYQLRMLFATICNENQPSNPSELFSAFLDCMIEDFMLGKDVSYKEIAVSKVLNEINNYFKRFGKTNEDFDLPMPIYTEEPLDDGSLLSQEQNRLNALDYVAKLNSEQRKIFKKIVENIANTNRSKCFYVDGPGGTGKTFLIKVK